MNVSLSSRVLILKPKVLSVTLGVFWAVLVLVISIIADVAGQGGLLTDLFVVIYPGYATSFPAVLLGVVWGFVHGYLFGYLIALFYSIFCEQILQKNSHNLGDWDPAQTVNIIREGEGNPPYTIVFVANPFIAQHGGGFERDEIMGNMELFWQTVLRCLRAFASNELLQLPEIFHRLRFVAIFDEAITDAADQHALCEEVADVGNILAPRENLQIVRDFVYRHIDYADVIFAISASRKLTRSAARFTEESGMPGVPFRFTFGGKITESSNQRLHAYQCEFPGVVGLSAWDDRIKTPLHEFAHAMSSVQNGVIHDEYADTTGQSLDLINKKFRNNPGEPIPNHYAEYQLGSNPVSCYDSDRNRSDKEPDWVSYTPEKEAPDFSCIMDVAYDRFRYDKLIFDFMYDRLLTKINRP